MKENRNLWNRIFGPITKAKNYIRYQMMSGNTAYFAPWSNDPYSADVVRAAVDAIARNAAKLKPRHIRRVGKDILNPGSNLETLLQTRPNEYMSTYDLLYRTVTNLLIDNNSFLYPEYDATGSLMAIWPVQCNSAEFLEAPDGELWVKFTSGLGKIGYLPYSQVIHLRRHFYKSDLLGEANTALNTTLEAVSTANQGISQAIKTSASLRGLLKITGNLNPKDLKAQRDTFTEDFLNIGNAGGIAALDSKADYKELNSNPVVINAAQMRELRNSVYRYFGVSEAIVMGCYTEDEWNSFYESTLEPLAVQMSLEFTTKLFTSRERGFGNEIIFESNRLQYASAKTKISLLKDLAPLGLFTINEGREIFNLAPVEGGDKRLVTLNVVDASKQNQYQLGETDNTDEGSDK